MGKIEELMNPLSVAIIGASTDPSKIGHQILKNIISGGYKGEVFPVNPKAAEILGLKTFADISKIEELVGLAVIAVPAALVIPVLKQCAEKKVKSVAVISAGFAETGIDGEKLQEEALKICRDSGMTMLGPNCLGLINADVDLNASFAETMPKSGNISLISQSGAMISALIDWSFGTRVGFSKIFSMGNEADINEELVFEYLYNDPNTAVIVAYLEKINVNNKLTELLIKYSKTKPTIVLFGGKTSIGAKAASSHTGSIISSYLAVETYLKQAGIIVAKNMSELFMFCQIFSNFQKIDGDNLAIITNAGGPAIITCDELFSKGLKLASFSKNSSESLLTSCRSCANISNPIDLLGDATDKDYQNAFEIIEKDGDVNGIIILLTPQSSTDVNAIAQAIAGFKSEKPVITVFIGGSNLEKAREIIENSKKPCYLSPNEAVDSIKALIGYSNSINQLLPSAEGKEIYKEDQKTKILNNYNLPILEYGKADSFDELKQYVKKIGYPVVLKTAKLDIVHKSDSGGVKLNILNETDLKYYFDQLGSPVIVGKMIKGKQEIFLGIKKDPNVGTLIAFGTGGIYSEIYKDFSYRVSPITKDVALEMINETKIGKTLQGARGQEKYNMSILAEIIVNAAKFADQYENIKEIDFNPIIASYPFFHIVDIRIIER